MIERKHFVSKKNYMRSLLLDWCVNLAFFLWSKIGLAPKQGEEGNRVLFIELAHLGDGLLLTPAIRFAKELKPELEITCLASSSAAKAFEYNPNVGRVSVINLPWYKSGKSSLLNTIMSFIRLVSRIKELHPDIIVNFRSTGYHREHLAMFFAGVPQRVGFGHKGIGRLLTRVVPYVEGVNVARQKAVIVSVLLTGSGAMAESVSLCPEFFVSSQDGSNFSRLIDPPANKLIIGINMSAQHTFLWPHNHYVRLCELLHERWKPLFVFLGTGDFNVETEDVRSQLGFQTLSLVGKTTLEELIGVLKCLDLLVTVDTGMRHLANSVGISVVSLRNRSERTTDFGKYLVSEEVITSTVTCAECGKSACPLGSPSCMVEITPEMVATAVSVKLENTVTNCKPYEVIFDGSTQ